MRPCKDPWVVNYNTQIPIQQFCLFFKILIRGITQQLPTTLTGYSFNDFVANSSILAPTVSGGFMDRSFMPTSKMTAAGENWATVSRSSFFFCHRPSSSTKQSNIDIIKIKVSFRSVVKLLFQVTKESSYKRLTKDHCFWDTQHYFD